MPELTDEDQSILQSMMGSNLIDNRNLYRALPPQIVGAGLGERTMLGMPSSSDTADEQESLSQVDDMVARGSLQGDNRESLDGEGRGPGQRISPQLVQAMASALKPNLAQFQRPLTLSAKITRQAAEIMRRNDIDDARKNRFARQSEQEVQ